MDRDEALKLLNEYTKKEGLIKHAIAVEAVMRAYAEKFGEDTEPWGIVGLLHDFDYERYPSLDDHPAKGAQILREKGVPPEWITAILGHARHTGAKRESLMAKTLFAVDELTGFIVAVSLVRPSKRIADVAAKSVKKKMKDKAFAAAVNRDDIHAGAEELGIPLDEHISFVIEAMQKVADKLGL
jgi:putative nucleotidyltransferase with HDIG domain